ncbi:MAG: signal recognition particle protein [Gemmatimonadetes bacterium]|nr:signal recognition particle protein [Gemmatimonadota bacterium]
MFAGLSDKLSATLRSLASRGVLTEDLVREGLREVRRILLEADVGFEIARDFTERVRTRAVGVEQLKAVNPGQQLVKIVHDELVGLLGQKQAPLAFASVPPTVMLLVGLQGSGKTTTAAKLAARLKREQKAPFLVAADIYRPAAEEQLRQLGLRVGVGVFGAGGSADRRIGGSSPTAEPPARPTAEGRQAVVELVQAGIAAALRERARTVLVDTAGRLHVDDELMCELIAVRDAVRPQEILLVADGMTGQDAVRIATGFQGAVGLSGVILTKLDGDARGGAALSIFGAVGSPIKFVGVGEGLDALEPFDPVRMAGRILLQGDIVGLVERAERVVDREQAEQLAKRAVSKRGMDLGDFLGALKQIQSMGPIESLLGLLPGMNAKVLKQARVDPKRVKHIEAIILSMTPAERSRPEMLNGSRRARIARGAGRPVQEINQLLTQFEQMRKMMKGFGKLGRR